MGQIDTERYESDRGNAIVARQLQDGLWQVSVEDGQHRTQPAGERVRTAFEQFKLAEKVAAGIANDWGKQLGLLIKYAERAGFDLQSMEPEAVLDEAMLVRLEHNPGLRPYVTEVRELGARKEQYDTMQEAYAGKMRIAADDQVAGRDKAPRDFSATEVEAPGWLAAVQKAGGTRGVG